ncbi:unnamed protein product [Closterium sp. NIES-65]|nr:unnamed protein product [Closterium sp. NIES-65]
MGPPGGDAVAAAAENTKWHSARERQTVLAVASATADVIRSQGLSPSPTAYFAALFSALETAESLKSAFESRGAAGAEVPKPLDKPVNGLDAVLALLDLAIPLTPESIVRLNAARLLPLLTAAVDLWGATNATGPTNSADKVVGEELMEEEDEAGKTTKSPGGSVGGTGQAWAEDRRRVVAAAVDCLGYVIAARVAGCGDPKNAWTADVAAGFKAVLDHSVASQPKVRSVAQSALLKLLSTFRASPAALAAASTALVDFADALIVRALAPSKQLEQPRQQPRQQQQSLQEAAATSAAAVLRFISCLRPLLPLLSPPSLPRVTLRLVELLEIRHPLLACRVLDALHSLMSAPAPATSAATSPVSKSLISEVVARLLKQEGERQAMGGGAGGGWGAGGGGGAGGRGKTDVAAVRALLECVRAALIRLHAMDAEACVSLLPSTFFTLIDNLASGHEEVAFATADCLKALISTCLDDAAVAASAAIVQQRQAQEGAGGEAGGAGGGGGKGKAPVERVCVAVERALGYQFRASWDLSLLLVATLFDRIGPSSHLFLAPTLTTLADLHDLPDTEMAHRKHLHAALGAAVAAMGPSRFLSILPLGLDPEPAPAPAAGPSAAAAAGAGGAAAASANPAAPRVWLLPILRRHTAGESLSFVLTALLPLSHRLLLAAQQARSPQVDRPIAAKQLAALRAAVWSLLPAVASLAPDTAQVFPHLAKHLAEAVAAGGKGDEGDGIRSAVCVTLQLMVDQNRMAMGRPPLSKRLTAFDGLSGAPTTALASAITDSAASDSAGAAAAASSAAPEAEAAFRAALEDDDDTTDAERRAWRQLTADVAAANLAAMSASARPFLPMLFDAFVAAPSAKRGELQSAIRALAAVADPAALRLFFTNIMSKLLSATNAAASGGAASGAAGGDASKEAGEKRAMLMDLSLSLLPGLDVECCRALYNATRPAIQDKSAAVQKKAYKLLASLLETHPELLSQQSEVAAGGAEGAAAAGRGVLARAVLQEVLVGVGRVHSSIPLPFPPIFHPPRPELQTHPELLSQQSEAVAGAAGGGEAAAGGGVSARAVLEELLMGVGGVHSPSRHYRMKSLSAVLLDLAHSDVPAFHEAVAATLTEIVLSVKEAVAATLTEIVLSVKEVNRKARDAAYQLIIALAKEMQRLADEQHEQKFLAAGGIMYGGFSGDQSMDGAGSADDDDADSPFLKFFTMVMAGLASSTPHGQSAAVMALARLIFHFSSSLLHLVPSLLPSLLLLFRSPHRDVLKACLGLVKVLSVRLETADLEAHLPAIMSALLCTNEIVATRFKAKVRKIVQRLARRCGHATVAAVVPEEHQRLLTHIRKVGGSLSGRTGGGPSSQGQGEEAWWNGGKGWAGGREVARAAKSKEKKRGGAGAKGSQAGDGEEGGEGRSTMSGRSRARTSDWSHSNLFSDTSADGDFSDDEDYSDADEDERSVFGGKSRAAKSASRQDGSKKSAWSNALSSRASKKAQHGRPQLHERITETGGDTPLDLLDLAGTRRALSAPLLKPTRGTNSSAVGGRTGAGGGGSKRHRDGDGEEEGGDSGFEYTEDGKIVVPDETEGGEGGRGGGSGRKGGTRKGVGAGEDDGEGNLDYGVIEDDDVAMGDASLASARAAELAFGRRVRGARGAGGGGEGGEERGGAGAGGGGGRKKAKANSGQAIPSGKDKRGGKKQTGSGSGWSYTGDEYAAGSGRRAGGDVKKEGKLEPHAYWPFIPLAPLWRFTTQLAVSCPAGPPPRATFMDSYTIVYVKWKYQ